MSQPKSPKAIKKHCTQWHAIKSSLRFAWLYMQMPPSAIASCLTPLSQLDRLQNVATLSLLHAAILASVSARFPSYFAHRVLGCLHPKTSGIRTCICVREQ